MDFCPICGNLLFIKHDRDESVNALFCKTCVYYQRIIKPLKIKAKLVAKKIDDIVTDQPWGPTTTQGGKCGKCGHPNAYFKELQIRSADEGATLFFKCANKTCSFQWNTNN